jgi:hypothetical protein
MEYWFEEDQVVFRKKKINYSKSWNETVEDFDRGQNVDKSRIYDLFITVNLILDQKLSTPLLIISNLDLKVSIKMSYWGNICFKG